MVLRLFKIISTSGFLTALEYSAPPGPLSGLRGPNSEGQGEGRKSLQNIAKDMKVIGSVGRPKVVKLSASGGRSPPDSLSRGSAPGPRCGLRPRPPL